MVLAIIAVIALVGLGAIAGLAWLGLYIKNTKVIGPNEIGIISGKATKGIDGASMRVVRGRVRLKPFVEHLYRLNLNIRQVQVNVKAQTKDGINVELQSVADVAIDTRSDAAMLTAAKYYVGNEKEIERNVAQQLEGIVRDAVGKSEAIDLLQDRENISKTVFLNAVNTYSASETDDGQGLVVKAFNINNFRTDSDYFENLGKPLQAEARKNAEIAESNSQLEIAQKQNENQIAIQESNRQREAEEARIKTEIADQKAEAKIADEMAETRRRKELVDEQSAIAEAEAKLKERQLYIEEIKPAETRAEALKIDAEAQKAKRKIEADSQAEIQKIEAENRLAIAETESQARQKAADAEKYEKTARVEAEAYEAEQIGEAQAKAIAAEGKARAEAERALAEALATNDGAALRKLAIEAQPEIARAFASAYTNVDSINIVGRDNAGQLTESVQSTYQNFNNLLKNNFGIDISSLGSTLSSVTEPVVDEESVDEVEAEVE